MQQWDTDTSNIIRKEIILVIKHQKYSPERTVEKTKSNLEMDVSPKIETITAGSKQVLNPQKGVSGPIVSKPNFLKNYKIEDKPSNHQAH